MRSFAQTAFARTVMSTLRASGVEHLVFSPGSRSTPFLLAARHQGLRLHAVHDERCAGFFALGMARSASADAGPAVALLCTSGTAAGHYLPAVMEGSAAAVPLVVLSADRPPELHASGANQTTDQTHLFGSHVRLFLDLQAHDSERALRAVARQVARAVAIAHTPTPGPVHLNLRGRKPLKTTDPPGSLPSPPRISHPILRADESALAAVAQTLDSAEYPVVIAGPAPLSQKEFRASVQQLCEAIDAPLAADLTSQLSSTLPAHDLALRYLDADHVLQIGSVPIGSGVAAWMAGRPRTVLTNRMDHQWPDPEGDAEHVVIGAIGPALEHLARTVRARARPPWRARHRALARHVSAAREELLAEAHRNDEGAVVAAALAALDANHLLMIGNSLPVRHADLWAGPSRCGVVHQRGVSGIDGNVAAAAGTVVAAERPVLLVVGDTAFFHDVGGLACARDLPHPLVIVVVDNAGGHIFERLPVHEELDATAFEALFILPPRLDVEHATLAYGHHYLRVASAEQAHLSGAVRAAVDEALRGEGCAIIHVAGLQGGAEVDGRLARAIAGALGAAP